MQPFITNLHQKSSDKKMLTRDPKLKIDEAHLIQQCQQGNLDAFKSLYELHKHRIYNIAYRIHGDHEDAQDSVQDAFVVIYKKINSFRGDSAFSTWFYRIVVNTCLNNIRKSKTKKDRVDLCDSDYLAAEAIYDKNQPLEVILDEEIQNLPPGYRAIFVLYEIEGFSHQEISKMLNKSVGTSKSQLHRAEQLLQKRLKPYLAHI